MKSGICVINKSYIADDILMWVDHYLNYCGFDHIFTLYPWYNDDALNKYNINELVRLKTRE